jgi:signal transduction histidine kinase/ligand-binding sensor domain-containing protein
MRWRRIATEAACVLLCAVMGSPRVLAVDPTETLSELHHTQWTTREGAPPSVNALVQSKSGYLWLGTATGLFRFDGVRFERFALTDGNYSLNGDISGLLVTPTDELWIGMRLGGAFLLHQGKLTHYGAAEGLPHHSVFGFAIRRDGSIWAQTSEGLYVLGAAKRWHQVGQKWDYPATSGYSIYVDSSDTLWSRGPQGTFYLASASNKFKQSEVPGGLGKLGAAPDGRVWAADYDLGLIALNGGSLAVAGTRLGGTENGVANFVFDSDGGIWTEITIKDVGSLARIPDARKLFNAVDRLAPSEIQILEPPRGLTGENVFEMLEDQEGDVWIATTGGLDRFRTNKLHAALEPVLSMPGEAAITTDSGGAVWIANYSSFIKFLPGQTHPLVLSHMDPPMQLSGLWGDTDGSLWIGRERTSYLTRYANQKLERHELWADSKKQGTQVLLRDRSGALWISKPGDGLYRKDGDVWSFNGGFAELPLLTPLAMAADDGENLWIGYPDNQIAEITRGHVELRGNAEGLQVGSVLAIAARANRLWVGGTDGVFLYSKGRFWPLRNRDGSRFTSVSGIIQSNDGELWLNGGAGITQISAQQIGAFVNDPASRVDVDTLNGDDGLNGLAVQIRPLPTAAEGKDGRLWFTTSVGAFWIDPKHMHRNTHPPTVIIQSIFAGASNYPAADGATLPVRTSNFAVQYTATSLANPSRVRFRYQLEGVDAEWQDGGNRRQAFYTNVQPGPHRFRVVAANEDGVWNEAGAEIAFAIAPAFYQTNWFRVLVAVVLLICFWQLYRLRVHQLTTQVRGKLNARLEERERIARELHDTLLQSTQGLILLFQSFAARVGRPDPMRGQMEAALDQADQLLNEARDRVSDLRTAGLETDIALAIRRAGEEVFANVSVDFRVSTTGTPRHLTSSVADDIYRIAREALLNAARHADASVIEVEIAYEPKTLRLRIRDNGNGLDVESAEPKPRHFGLMGMRERANRIGASLKIVSGKGAGTDIEVVVSGAATYDRDPRAPRWMPTFLLPRARQK